VIEKESERKGRLRDRLRRLQIGCGGPAILLHYAVSLVQWVNSFLPVYGVSGSHPGDVQTCDGTGFLLLATSRYIGDPNVIDHWPRLRLCADNGKLH
jgi:hypothetical protein